MVNALIVKMINKWDIPFGDYKGTFEENQNEFYTDVLNLVEAKGMLPPPTFYHNVTESVIFACYDEGQYIHPSDSKQNQNYLWEPEDENSNN